MLGSESRRPLLDTAIRGCLAVALYIAFPPFSDVHRLWERASGLNTSWPTGAFEYPPIAALYFQPLAQLPSSRWAVTINGLAMVGAAVAITWLLMRISKDSGFGDGVDVQMWATSPAILLFLPINWDPLVVLASVIGVVALYQARESLSGLLHGVGTALKIFPGAIVLPVTPILGSWRTRVVFLASGLGVLATSYLIYSWVDPEGWRFHLDFASSRTDTESTIWGTLDRIASSVGWNLAIDTVNVLSTSLIALGLVLLTIWVARHKPGFAEVAVLALTVLLLFNKTFKPQYVLWVLPFYAWIRVSRFKVRLLEATAIVAFIVVYFAVPKWINPIESTIRAGVLLALAFEVINSSRRQAPAEVRP